MQNSNKPVPGCGVGNCPLALVVFVGSQRRSILRQSKNSFLSFADEQQLYQMTSSATTKGFNIDELHFGYTAADVGNLTQY